MFNDARKRFFTLAWLFFGCILAFLSNEAGAADRLIGLHPAQGMSPSAPRDAQKAPPFL